MDEVERLCDRVAVMRRGRVVARGTPEELVAAGGGSNLEDRVYRPDGERGGRV
jgi:ABC-2 type transport system ATP-binding protein